MKFFATITAIEGARNVLDMTDRVCHYFRDCGYLPKAGARTARGVEEVPAGLIQKFKMCQCCNSRVIRSGANPSKFHALFDLQTMRMNPIKDPLAGSMFMLPDQKSEPLTLDLENKIIKINDAEYVPRSLLSQVIHECLELREEIHGLKTAPKDPLHQIKIRRITRTQSLAKEVFTTWEFFETEETKSVKPGDQVRVAI